MPVRQIRRTPNAIRCQVRQEIRQILQAKAWAPFGGLVGEKVVNVLEVNLELGKALRRPTGLQLTARARDAVVEEAGNSDSLAKQPECWRPTKPVVVVIEQALQLRRLLRATLTGQGYRLLEVPTGTEGLLKVSARPPDLVLLDLRIPDMSAVDVIRRLRQWTRVPIIVLSALDDHRVRVAALDAGADDCVSTPFRVDELLARIRAALRRSGWLHERGTPAFNVGDLAVDMACRRVTVGGKDVHLTPIEYKILTTLVRHAGKVLTYSQLLNEVWGPTRATHANYLRVYMAHLRHKLEGERARPRYLLTEPRIGYRLAVE